MFNKLKISLEEDAVGKDFDGLISILKRNDYSFKKDLEKCMKLQAQINRILQNPNLDNFKKSVESTKLMKELYQYITKPSIQLFNYITPLEEKRSLVKEDKKALALKFIERKYSTACPKNKSSAFSSINYSYYRLLFFMVDHRI
ncbi:MAG: hypothetical protein WBIAU1_12000 [Wolbachia endosymbiont of Drosophila biauraria]|nr:MAG: hypothetical protein WBIAU1_12000 [Wolbachia endosymbiont of Drosophila biauraria]